MGKVQQGLNRTGDKDDRRGNTTDTRRQPDKYNGNKTRKCVHYRDEMRNNAYGGDRRRCSGMYKAFQDSAAVYTKGQQHVPHRDTYAATCTTKRHKRSHVYDKRDTSAATCTTKSNPRSRMYNTELQARPHVQQSHQKLLVAQGEACRLE